MDPIRTAVKYSLIPLRTVVQLPAEEYELGKVTSDGLRSVAGFGSWRSAQEGIRPLTTLVPTTPRITG